VVSASLLHATLPNLRSDGDDSDNVSARTLGFGVNIPSGTTAESCTAACQAAGGFTNAGLENGHECCKGASFRFIVMDHSLSLNLQGATTLFMHQHNELGMQIVACSVLPRTMSTAGIRIGWQYISSLPPASLQVPMRVCRRTWETSH
jgi:hypothetical protein